MPHPVHPIRSKRNCTAYFPDPSPTLSLQRLRIPKRISSYKLARPADIPVINGTAPGYLQSCFTRLANLMSWQRLLPIVWQCRQFVSLRSTGKLSQFLAPTHGTSFHPVSHLHRHLHFSVSVLRHSRSAAHTRTSSFDVYIFLHHIYS